MDIRRDRLVGSVDESRDGVLSLACISAVIKFLLSAKHHLRLLQEFRNLNDGV